MKTQTSRKVSLKVIGAVIAVSASAGFVWARMHGSASAKAMPPVAMPNISVATAQKGDIEVTLDALGTVTPVNTATITARVQGQITKVLYTEGQMVTKGTPLIEIDPRPYKALLVQAQGQLAKDEATLKEDRIDLERYKTAYESQAVSKQQVDDQVQVVKQFEGAVLADKGSVESAQANLDYCYINAPISGRLGLRLVDVGNIIQAGSTTPLVVITQVDPITVVYNLAEDDISKVQNQLKDTAAMEVEAYDRSQSKKLATGTFLSLDNQVDPTTGTIKARATYANPDNALFPNEFVNVKMHVKTEHGQLRIPTTAIQKGSQGNFVYVVSGDNVIHVQPVSPGLNDATYTSVSGVNEGDRVATSNFDKLQESTHVKIHADDGPGSGPSKSVAKEDSKAVAKDDSKTTAEEEGKELAKEDAK